MNRGRSYYDPIVQVPGRVEDSEDKSRIELFPVGQDSTSRPPTDVGKWMGRRINSDGSVAEYAPGDFDHDRALRQAQALWPGLTVYELNQEIQDSTWDGTGPSPRLWQLQGGKLQGPDHVVIGEIGDAIAELGRLDAPTLRAFSVEAGTYLMLDDVLLLLEGYAVVYDGENNPSAALALRETAKAIREPF
jgi:hypothetical protein